MVRRSVLVTSLGLSLLALAVALVAFVWTGNRERAETQPSTAVIGGPFTLTDASGKAVTDRTYAGKWLLIYFGYTFCPDACPIALAKMSEALKKLGPAAESLQTLFITVDPKRDTASVMAEYLKSFDPRIVGLTGTQAQIDAVVKGYKVYVSIPNTGGSDYLVDHSAYFYVMDPQGRFVNVIDPGVSGDEIANRLLKAMGN